MPNFEAERQIIAQQIRVRLSEIHQTVYSQRQPVTGLKACVTGPGKGPERMPRSGWKPFRVHDRWGGFDQTTWFKLKVVVPDSMKGRRVAALVRPGGESLAYVNGRPATGLDPNRDAIHLVERARGGETFEIAIESVPSVRFDEYHYFQYADIAAMCPEAWDFYWDVLVAMEVWQQLPQNYAPQRQLLELIEAAVKQVDLNHKSDPSYLDTITEARRFLLRGLGNFETSYGVGKLTLAGHAHIDTAWLWPLRETERKCGRTWATVLDLMERYPEYHFSCSQPAQYERFKKNYPELYRRIKRRVKEGRWEPCGAMWVEPDQNVPSGESLVRQILFGKRFFRKEFGIDVREVWTPDTFGYTWALPQILAKAQVDAFLTTKISWNQFTEFPYSMFQWEGPDGSRVLALMLLNYNGNPIPEQLLGQWDQFKQKERVDECLFPYGWGDGGGGPTMAMIEHGKRLGNMVGMPRCAFGQLHDCVERIRTQVDFDALPVWNGELYFELHRGCQTSQARTKRFNRKLELLLRDAEFLSSLALVNGGTYEYDGIQRVWKTLLTNQFHDILPGSSITEVYATAEEQYAQAEAQAKGIRDRAIGHLTKRIDTSGPGKPILVINTLPWARSDVVVAAMPVPRGRFNVLGPDGAAVPCQRTADGAIAFQAAGVPPLGYAVYRLVSGTRRPTPDSPLEASEKGIENRWLRVRFDKYGRLTSVYDKIERREVLPKGQKANVLQLFEDRPQCFEAWDVDFNFEEKMWEPGPAETIEILETGSVRAVVRIVRKTEKSVITQDLVLAADSPRLDFVTHVDWHDRQTLLKAAFPVDVRASEATFEIQYGAIQRPTHTNRDADLAQFEVPAHKWADLSEGNYGVTLLNDCKYGYDVKGNALRLSLLRAPVDPDPKADEGEHRFTYALYPHGGDWRFGAVQQGFELNVLLLAAPVSSAKGPLAAAHAFASVDTENVVIDTIKRHEDSNALIIRLYEAYGQRGNVTLTFAKKPKHVAECDLMEENDRSVNVRGNNLKFYITPFEIRTFKVVF
ncbi:MAG TPA: alpha-mannosidase [Candidatus Hydrogenedentes bacterium]|nr:alpha-mannosidase [Candidatus Hydrogenedentota bacterium]